MSSLKNLALGTGQSEETLDRDQEKSRVPGRLWQTGIFQPLNHVLATDGKRLRAQLIELSYRAAGGGGDPPLDLIEFVELLHAGTLVIDDIQDGSAMRRGQSTLHEVVGTPLAINTGNWMYFSALEKLQDLPLPAEHVFAMLSESISTIRRGHEGQALDLTAKVVEIERRDICPTVRAISRLKTGGVTALGAKLGAALAGANSSRQRAFHAFGMQLGIGLQMQNDLVELSSATTFGGRTDDLRNGRVTWPWAWVSRLKSKKQFANLQCLLRDRSEDNLQTVASKLLDSVSNVGKESIRRKLRGALACLAGETHPQSSEALLKLANRIEAYNV